jgi:glucans biosynthesis protein
MSARGLTIDAGADAEEFPFFREFWVETPDAGADHITIFALLDGQSTTGAYRFDLYPGPETFIEVGATLFPRRPIGRLGLAPLTSMFFTGESTHRAANDFRPELHDSDGLLIRSSTDEQIWRPLRNPPKPETSAFLDKDLRGFGLMQRDRVFEHYQDLDLAYELRPSYWVEPHGSWGEGRIELIEMPTADEANDNIVASWVPKNPAEAGKPLTFGYRLSAVMDAERLSPGGWAINTFRTEARALGSLEAPPPGAQRFVIDFTGGDLAYYVDSPEEVQLVPTTTNGRILRSFIAANIHIRGFRAGIDLQLDGGQSTDLRAFLKAGSRTLTETWTFPWKNE